MDYIFSQASRNDGQMSSLLRAKRGSLVTCHAVQIFFSFKSPVIHASIDFGPGRKVEQMARIKHHDNRGGLGLQYGKGEA